MRLVIKNSIQLGLHTLVFSKVLRHSNYNNMIISISIQGVPKKTKTIEITNNNLIVRI